MMSKKGRNRKQGERYRSGDLRPTGEPLAPAAWQRQLQAARLKIIDPKFGSELGRLQAAKELTATQVTAGERIGEIYGRYERFSGKRRSAKSPSYESGLGSIGAADDRLSQEERDRMQKIEGDAFRAFQALSGYMQHFPRDLRAMIEHLCVDDRALNPTRLSEIRQALGHLAEKLFGITSKLKAPRRPSNIVRFQQPALTNN